MTADPAVVGRVFDVAVVGLLAAVQEALPDLKAAGDGAVLVTNGAFGELNPQIDAVRDHAECHGPRARQRGQAQAGRPAERATEGDGVYVGEVMVAGMVKGTPSDRGGPTIDPAAIAGQFWALYQARGEIRARVS